MWFTLARIFVGLFLAAFAFCLGGLNVDTWRMAIWPQGDVMQQLRWASAVIALMGSALTLFIAGLALFVLFCPIENEDEKKSSVS